MDSMQGPQDRHPHMHGIGRGGRGKGRGSARGGASQPRVGMAQAPAALVHSQVPVAPQPQVYAATPAPGPLKVLVYVDQQPLSQAYYNCMPYPALLGAEQQMVPQQAIPPLPFMYR